MSSLAHIAWLENKASCFETGEQLIWIAQSCGGHPERGEGSQTPPDIAAFLPSLSCSSWVRCLTLLSFRARCALRAPSPCARLGMTAFNLQRCCFSALKLFLFLS